MRDRELTVAVAQFEPGLDVARNLDTVEQMTRAAVARGAGLVVFPEFSTCFEPSLGERMGAAAEPLDGSIMTRLGQIAAAVGAHLVVGTAELAGDGGDDPTAAAEASARFHNTVVALGPDGSLVACYRKLHLYDAFGQRESERVAPGVIAAPEVFVVDGFTVGLQTCYDLRFPEVTRRLVDAGADVVLVPAEWVRGPHKLHHWRTLAAARAIENTVFLAAADQTGKAGLGHSMILDPWGSELAALGEDPGVVVAICSGAKLDEVRELNPALRLRRFTVTPR
ncbi:MAG TPA: carbon-nitrogen hydrolase family protein [Candidatus Lumbricidophila sp.]|nr:carbon-nitrogen hydrolase family protein [Candidatus Lumbricidophila sp.]